MNKSNPNGLILRALSIGSAVALVLSSIVAIAGPAVAAAPVALSPGDVSTAATVLGELTVAADLTAPYSRSEFELWIDADANGCDTRQEVLVAESVVPVTYGSGCTVTAGEWDSWYDGAVWTNPSDVDIDHFVPLGDAWRSGAANWTADERKDYANDLDFDLTLVAVTDNVNSSKGDRDPAHWLPPKPRFSVNTQSTGFRSSTGGTSPSTRPKMRP
ncbi:HNH endonuclease family protein [Leifsonia poae]|uniref:HNH endonuclease family protein n=1 Tax=Leifsonia poae TaxID=110933 RepID=UPI003D67A5D1